MTKIKRSHLLSHTPRIAWSFRPPKSPPRSPYFAAPPAMSGAYLPCTPSTNPPRPSTAAPLAQPQHKKTYTLFFVGIDEHSQVGSGSTDFFPLQMLSRAHTSLPAPPPPFPFSPGACPRKAPVTSLSRCQADAHDTQNPSTLSRIDQRAQDLFFAFFLAADVSGATHPFLPSHLSFSPAFPQASPSPSPTLTLTPRHVSRHCRRRRSPHWLRHARRLRRWRWRRNAPRVPRDDARRPWRARGI